jgi:hypothetical protein
MKNNYKSFLNLLLLSGIVVFLSSCAREHSSISYNNEKLRKQSLEIENSKPSEQNIAKEEKTTAPAIEQSAPEKKVVAENKTTNRPEVLGKKEEKKISPVQNLIAKKIAKKMNTSASKALDQKLKYAVIFAAVGVILYILGGIVGVFWILGTIALVVALVFLLLWILEQ